MTIKELVRLCGGYEEEIVICSGSLRRNDIVYNGTVEDIPNDLLNCIIRGWKVSLRDILNQHSYCLFVQIDDRVFSTTNESRTKKKKRSIKESYEGSHTFGYIEPDGEFYQDIFGEFTVEEYYDEESDEVLGWTWYCSDDFEPTEPYFSTAQEAYEDAKYVLTPDDGSELVIDE